MASSSPRTRWPTPATSAPLIRTAEGLGADGVLLVGDGADPLSPQAVKASMGSLFHLPVVHLAGPGRILRWAADARVRTVTSSARRRPRSPTPTSRARSPAAAGRGAHRPAAAALERSDVQVSIPMSGRATSFNVAVAAGILMYEVANGFDLERGRSRTVPR
jgi:TrmH family RNA methyltransferase